MLQADSLPVTKYHGYMFQFKCTKHFGAFNALENWKLHKYCETAYNGKKKHRNGQKNRNNEYRFWVHFFLHISFIIFYLFFFVVDSKFQLKIFRVCITMCGIVCLFHLIDERTILQSFFFYVTPDLARRKSSTLALFVSNISMHRTTFVMQWKEMNCIQFFGCNSTIGSLVLFVCTCTSNDQKKIEREMKHKLIEHVHSDYFSEFFDSVFVWIKKKKRTLPINWRDWNI